MATVEMEIQTSSHTYRLRFDKDYREQGFGYPHDTKVLAVDGEELDETEEISFLMDMEPEEFQELVEAISDATRT